MTSDGLCFVCNVKVEPVDEQTLPTDEPFHCQECDSLSHPQCVPTSKFSHLKGDVLFAVTCAACSDDNELQVERMRVSWLQVIHLALYNLSIKESGRQGFFRWRDDICSFIEKHWSVLLTDKIKTNNWTSTIAGTLSVNCPKLFKSGQQHFKEPGWWALQVTKPPPRNYDESILKRPKPKAAANETFSVSFADSGLGRGRRKRKVISYKPESYRTAKSATPEDIKRDATIPDFSQDEKNDECSFDPIKEDALKIKIKKEDTTEDSDSFLLTSLDTKLDNEIAEAFTSHDSYEDSVASDFLSFDDSCALIDTEEFSRVLSSEKVSECDSETNSCNDDTQSTNTGYSTFTSYSKLNDYSSLDAKKSIPSSRIKASDLLVQENLPLLRMTSNQEFEFLKMIEQYPEVLASDPATRRLRQQLILRKRKRELGLPLFDLDKYVFDAIKKCAPPEVESRLVRNLPKFAEDKQGQQSRIPLPATYHHPALQDVNVLDRFLPHGHTKKENSEKDIYYRSFTSRLVGRGHELYSRSIISPYTGRVLKPYIRRDFDCFPPKVRILRELLNYTHRNDPHWISPSRSSIDYCYVQPHHIPAINAMCREFFWPGIDMTECLQYPDFSCVALYKKIVIGFAFLVPDVKYNEAYISFVLVHPDWRRAGIATFFLYHLIQTCMGKDITLHVSASNSSMLLYQRFGFKVEEIVLNFYEKYMRDDSSDSRHAFFLRLQR